MSGPDDADRDKSFLARWSQRKQEAKRPDSEQDAPVADGAGSPEPPAPQGESGSEPEFDLSTLPRLEELTESTDITAFLRKGVPEHLRNAALRKSWALDPAIRNYVNPALEYAYDWNTPGGVPGSSELGAGVDVARMVLQIMGDGSQAEPSNPACNPAIEGRSSPAPSAEPDPLPKPPSRRLGELADIPEGDNGRADQAAESEAANPVAPQQQMRRHGTAKPIV